MSGMAKPTGGDTLPGGESYFESLSRVLVAWDRFWFTPARPHTLCVLRILTGVMLLYCHVVLASDLSSFIGNEAWMNNEMARQLHDGAFGPSDWARSYLWHMESPMLIQLHHGLMLIVAGSFLIGFATRFTVPLALFLQLMYLHRMTGALFGLDQIVTYATMYLAITPCGSRFSVDAALAKRFHQLRERSTVWRWILPDDSPSISANIGTRLLQLHLCVIYLFGGLSKARGESWWDGSAVWLASANYEYQSLDMTWLSNYPAVLSALSNATLFWEVFYCALIWPKVTRPIVLAVAVGVHGSIGLSLGMATFGLMMIFANGVFLPPRFFQSKAQRLSDAENATSFADDEILAAEESEEELDRQLSNPDLSATERAKLKEKKEKIRKAAARVKRRYRALKKREAKYQARVQKLREREARIKTIVKKRRQKRDQSDDQPSDGGQ